MLIWVDTPTGSVGCREMAHVENLLKLGGRLSHAELDIGGIRHHVALSNPVEIIATNPDKSQPIHRGD